MQAVFFFNGGRRYICWCRKHLVKVLSRD